MVSYMRREHRASMRIRIVSACLNGKTPTNASFFRIHFPSRCCYCRLFIKSQRFTSVYMSFLPVRMNGGSVRRLGTRSTSKLASCTLHKDAHAPNVFKTMLKHVHEQRALSMICRSNRRRRRRRKKGHRNEEGAKRQNTFCLFGCCRLQHSKLDCHRCKN